MGRYAFSRLKVETMKKNNIKKLSELHAQIWFLDDDRAYGRLQKKLEELIKLRGGRGGIAQHISTSYRTYGLLQDNKIRTNSTLIFKKIFRNFHMAYTSTGVQYPWSQAYFNMLWWKEFFYKDQLLVLRYLKIIFAIFLLHLAKLGFSRPFAVVSCSTYCILAGSKGHDKKNFEVCKHYLKKYWGHVPPDVNFISF